MLKAPGQQTRDALLDVTIEALNEHGERGVRIAEISRRSGVSVGSIYHHFGDRDGLISAARARQIRSSHPAYGAEVFDLALSSGSAQEFVAGLRDVIRRPFSRDLAADRLQRIAYIGSASRRPALLNELRGQQTELISGAQAFAQLLIDRGWVKDGVQARVFATFVLALEIGSVVGDLDAHRVSDEAWSDVILLVFEGFFRLDDATDAVGEG